MGENLVFNDECNILTELMLNNAYRMLIKNNLNNWSYYSYSNWGMDIAQEEPYINQIEADLNKLR